MLEGWVRRLRAPAVVSAKDLDNDLPAIAVNHVKAICRHRRCSVLTIAHITHTHALTISNEQTYKAEATPYITGDICVCYGATSLVRLACTRNTQSQETLYITGWTYVCYDVTSLFRTEASVFSKLEN